MFGHMCGLPLVFPNVLSRLDIKCCVAQFGRDEGLRYGKEDLEQQMRIFTVIWRMSSTKFGRRVIQLPDLRGRTCDLSLRHFWVEDGEAKAGRTTCRLHHVHFESVFWKFDES